jgi:hypothetical protein
VPSSSKPSGSTAPATAAGSSSSSTTTTRSSGGSEGTVEIDCAAEQQKHKQQRPAPVSFGEKVAQQQQSSVMLTIAINQVWRLRLPAHSSSCRMPSTSAEICVIVLPYSRNKTPCMCIETQCCRICRVLHLQTVSRDTERVLSSC